MRRSVLEREEPVLAPVFATAAAAAGFELDEAQRPAAQALEAMLARIGRRAPTGRRARRPHGLYLWGPVGRGKTWLLDTFYGAAPTGAKRRLHFHAFFRDLHAAVHRHRGAPHAFDAAVAELLDGVKLLCFDELHLHDVGDAMLLTRMLRTLFERRIVLVATSNYPPGGLLPNPLHHHLFEPGIAMLESGLDVLAVDGPTDYRTLAGTASRRGFRSGAYLWPGTTGQLARRGLAHPEGSRRAQVRLGSRTLPALSVREDLVWFDFHDLCDAPVSTLDVLTVAERFGTWVVSDVPRLVDCSPDAQQRFVGLVDVLHDRDAVLTLVAQAPLDQVLAGPLAPPDIRRTASRLRLLQG